jgi:rhomboid protease GluP
MGQRDGSGGATGPRMDGAGAVVRSANRGGILPSDLLVFRRTLDDATRRAVVTPLIVLACGAWFAAMTADRVPMLLPTAAQLVGWGANDGARVILRHEFWRLGASVFVHGGIIHLVVNMWSLLMIGPLVERIFGHLAFAVLYLAAGMGGAIASAATPPLRVSVGASGAICGVLGGLLAFLVVHHRAIPSTVLRQLRKNVLGVVVFMAVLGAAVPKIDQAAHLGGLAVGFLCGLLLIGPWPIAPRQSCRLLARRVALSAAIAVALAGTAVALAHLGDTAIAADRRLNDLTEQLAPIVGEFDSIRRDLARSVGRLDRVEDSRDPQTARPAVRELRARAAANKRRMRAVRAGHPELRAIRESLCRALAGEVDRLDALDHYLETRDRAFLEAAHDARAATVEGIKHCNEERLRYMARHGLRPQLNPVRPAP